MNVSWHAQPPIPGRIMQLNFLIRRQSKNSLRALLGPGLYAYMCPQWCCGNWITAIVPTSWQWLRHCTTETADEAPINASRCIAVTPKRWNNGTPLLLESQCCHRSPGFLNTTSRTPRRLRIDMFARIFSTQPRSNSALWGFVYPGRETRMVRSAG